MIDLTYTLQVLDVSVALVNLLGVPVAITIFAMAKRREQRDRETGTYATLNQQYVDFLRIALEHPDLPVFGAVVEHKPLSPTQNREVECAFLMLISLIENAYLLYRQHGSNLRENQWAGWRDYILDYFSNPYFREKWPELGRQFDREFFDIVNELIAHPTPAVPESP